MNASCIIRPAVAADASAIHALICELADYEKMSTDVVSTPGMIGDSLASGHTS